MTERLSNKNPCINCKVDRQIGNPNRWECECSRCEKPNDWKNECVKKLAEYETAEEEGRLLFLPCKVGQCVYTNFCPPRKVSDEQREAAGERFRKMWEEKKGEGCNE